MITSESENVCPNFKYDTDVSSKNTSAIATYCASRVRADITRPSNDNLPSFQDPKNYCPSFKILPNQFLEAPKICNTQIGSQSSASSPKSYFKINLKSPFTQLKITEQGVQFFSLKQNNSNVEDCKSSNITSNKSSIIEDLNPKKLVNLVPLNINNSPESINNSNLKGSDNDNSSIDPLDIQMIDDDIGVVEEVIASEDEKLYSQLKPKESNVYVQDLISGKKLLSYNTLASNYLLDSILLDGSGENVKEGTKTSVPFKIYENYSTEKRKCDEDFFEHLSRLELPSFICSDRSSKNVTGYEYFYSSESEDSHEIKDDINMSDDDGSEILTANDNALPISSVSLDHNYFITVSFDHGFDSQDISSCSEYTERPCNDTTMSLNNGKGAPGDCSNKRKKRDDGGSEERQDSLVKYESQSSSDIPVGEDAKEPSLRKYWANDKRDNNKRRGGIRVKSEEKLFKSDTHDMEIAASNSKESSCDSQISNHSLLSSTLRKLYLGFSPSLSFDQQAILEYIFRYECYPTIWDLSKLSKVLKVSLRSLCNWMTARQDANKKCMISPTNHCMIKCYFCSSYKANTGSSVMSHLISEEHVKNMKAHLKSNPSIVARKNVEENNNSKLFTDEAENDSDFSHLPENFPSSLTPSFISTDIASTNMYAKVVKDLIKQSHHYPAIKHVLNPPKVKGQHSENFSGYKCPNCLKIFPTKWLLLKHSLTHKKFACSECSEVFFDDQLLKIHFQKHLVHSIKGNSELCLTYCCSSCHNVSCICEDRSYFIPTSSSENLLCSQSFCTDNYDSQSKINLKDVASEGRIRRNVKAVKHSKNVKLDARKKSALFIAEENDEAKCCLCDYVASSSKDLNSHIPIHTVKTWKSNTGNRSAETASKVGENPAADSFYICFYCRGEFKRKSVLSRHLKLECPNLELYSVDWDTNYIDSIGKSNYYHIKVKTDLKTEVCLKCKKDVIEFEYKHHSLVCTRPFPKTKNSNKTSLSDRDRPMSERSTKKLCLFNVVCHFCGLPFSSIPYFLIHINLKCKNIPHLLTSKVKNGCLSLKDVEKVCNKIPKNLRPPKANLILENILNIDKRQNLSVERGNCQFCIEKDIGKSLLMHLILDCKAFPKILKENLKELSKGKFLPNTGKGKEIDDAQLNVDGYEELSDESVLEVLDTSSGRYDENALILMVYDCHLCENKYELQDTFLRHMLISHCRTIESDIACRWLSFTYTSDINVKSATSSDDLQSCENDLKLQSSMTPNASSDQNFSRDDCESLDKEKQNVSPKETLVENPDSYKPSRSVQNDKDLDNCVETVQLNDADFMSLL